MSQLYSTVIAGAIRALSLSDIFLPELDIYIRDSWPLNVRHHSSFAFRHNSHSTQITLSLLVIMVQITVQALYLSLLSCAIASPLAITTTDAEATDAVARSKRAQNRCEWYVNGQVYYTVWMGGWGNHDGTSLSGCGTGFLDNLRGQHGGFGIFDWGCTEIHENPHDTMVKFNVNDVGGDYTGWVERAFRYASPGGSQSVSCQRI